MHQITSQFHIGASELISQCIVKETLHFIKFHSHQSTCIILLTPHNQFLHLAWANDHHYWTMEDECSVTFLTISNWWSSLCLEETMNFTCHQDFCANSWWFCNAVGCILLVFRRITCETEVYHYRCDIHKSCQPVAHLHNCHVSLVVMVCSSKIMQFTIVLIPGTLG